MLDILASKGENGATHLDPGPKIQMQLKWLNDYFSGNYYPISVEIDPTNLCPLKCGHCYWKFERQKDKSSLSEDTLVSIITQLKELGTRSIIWTGGGEPLANSVTLKSIRLSASFGLFNGMYTNALLMNKQSARFLVEHLQWARFHIGASNPKNYSIVHGVPENYFNIVYENMKYFASINDGRVDCGIGLPINQFNFSFIKDIPFLAADLSLNYFQAKFDLRLLSSLAYIKWWYKIVKPYLKKVKQELNNQLEVFLPDYRIYLKNRAPYCHARHFTTSITADGEVSFCKLRRNKPMVALGNVHDSPLSSIFANIDNHLLGRIIKPSTCFKSGLLCQYNDSNLFIENLKYNIYKIDNRHKHFF